MALGTAQITIKNTAMTISIASYSIYMAIYRYDHYYHINIAKSSRLQFMQTLWLHTNKVIAHWINHTHYILSLINMYASIDLLEALDCDEINLYS